MSHKGFTGKVKELIDSATRGNAADVDYILSHLTAEATFSMTRFVDYALGLVENEAGVARIEHFLFNGTQMQRNYCALFFNRRDDWQVVKQAYEAGLIDEIQAYAR